MESNRGKIMETIISAAITGLLALLGIIITNVQSNKKIEHQDIVDSFRSIIDSKEEKSFTELITQKEIKGIRSPFILITTLHQKLTLHRNSLILIL